MARIRLWVLVNVQTGPFSQLLCFLEFHASQAPSGFSRGVLPSLFFVKHEGRLRQDTALERHSIWVNGYTECCLLALVLSLVKYIYVKGQECHQLLIARSTGCQTKRWKAVVCDRIRVLIRSPYGKGLHYRRFFGAELQLCRLSEHKAGAER